MTAIGDTLTSSDEASRVRKWVLVTRHKLPTLPLKPLKTVWTSVTLKTHLAPT